MRVGIIALLHESNTFIDRATTLEHFEQNLLVEGAEARQRLSGSHHEIAGFFDTLDEEGIEAVPIFAARALPYGTIAAETFDELQRRMFAALERAGPLDGVLAAPHGATVSERHADADGFWLTELRKRLGKETPIIATLDAHANVSPKMVDACDAIVGYRTNPHLDQRLRGREAARLMTRTLRGEIRPVMAAAFPPLAINIESQQTDVAPCLPLYQLADKQLALSQESASQPGKEMLLSNSIFLGFPYADVAEMGSSLLAVANDDAGAAKQAAMELASALWNNRAAFDRPLIDIDEALDRAAKLKGPICLLDMGDNVGGGSPGDGTHLAHALLRRNVGDSFVCLCDPAAARQAESAGIGARVSLRVGGHTDNLHGQPLEAEFTVVGFSDGVFDEPEPRHGGMSRFDQGRTAIVRTDSGLTIMLTTLRMTPFSLRQLTSCHVDPAAFHILTAKGVNAPVAAYQPVCQHLIRVDTEGSTSANMRRLTYAHRRRPLFPLEKDGEWTPTVHLGVQAQTR